MRTHTTLAAHARRPGSSVEVEQWVVAAHAHRAGAAPVSRSRSAYAAPRRRRGDGSGQPEDARSRSPNSLYSEEYHCNGRIDLSKTSSAAARLFDTPRRPPSCIRRSVIGHLRASQWEWRALNWSSLLHPGLLRRACPTPSGLIAAPDFWRCARPTVEAPRAAAGAATASVYKVFARPLPQRFRRRLETRARRMAPRASECLAERAPAAARSHPVHPGVAVAARLPYWDCRKPCTFLV